MSAQRYVIRRSGAKVLTFRPVPGRLLSTAFRPPGFVPPAHPFLDAQALDPFAEPELASLLQRSDSVAKFLELLRSNGFDIEEEAS